MTSNAVSPPPPTGHTLTAAAVHAFTALGAIAALLAMLAVMDGRYEHVFFWLGVAVIIDGIDGTIARKVRVSERLPRFSGERLDLVVDYITYVFVPAVALVKSGLLQGNVGIALASLILLSSLFHFSDTESKDDDYNFIGFPAIWNIVAFYLFALAPPLAVVAGVVLILSLLSFVPMRWAHPMRVVQARVATIAVTVIFAIASITALVAGFPAKGGLWWALFATACYGLARPVIWQLTRHR